MPSGAPADQHPADARSPAPHPRRRSAPRAEGPGRQRSRCQGTAPRAPDPRQLMFSSTGQQAQEPANCGTSSSPPEAESGNLTRRSPLQTRLYAAGPAAARDRPVHPAFTTPSTSRVTSRLRYGPGCSFSPVGGARSRPARPVTRQSAPRAHTPQDEASPWYRPAPRHTIWMLP